MSNVLPLFGKPTKRIDGVAKVTGAARYASDEPLSNTAFAYLVMSNIATGRIESFNLDRAKAVPGVIDILNYENVGKQSKTAPGPDGSPTTTTLESAKIWHAGQIVAVVVADTYEAARDAAHKVEVVYASERPSSTFGSPGVEVKPRKPQRGPDPKKGDAAAAFTAAAVKIEADYSTPTQHHNALELFTTTCTWDGPKLTIYEPSQYMWGLKASVAKQLGIDPNNVRTVSRFIGGAFGSKGPGARTAWIAIAAKRIGRPVKLMATRGQGFTIATYRAETRQHVKLGATATGKLTALSHEGWEVTSRPSEYNVAGVASTARMYACPNISTAVSIVHADRSTPGFMRAPPETPYMFALESAIDELAHASGMDPVELRRLNDTQTDPVSGLPFSSRSLMKCYDQASAQFGWNKRSVAPGSMKEGDWLVGYGCASACYPTNIAPCAARLSVTPQGKATIGMAAHEIGTGAYTTVAITVANALGLKLEDITVHMGDSELPPVMVAGGSNNAASTAHVAAKACDEVRRRLADAASDDKSSVLYKTDPKSLLLREGTLTALGGGKSEDWETAVNRIGARLEVYAENVPSGMPPAAMEKLYQGSMAMLGGDSRKDVTAYSFGAHFVEVRIHSRTREVRVPRVVSAFAAGTIINPLAAHSQFMGGVIWGISSALHEQTEIDEQAARYVNDNLADYLVPVNADTPSIEIIMVPEEDERVNPLGVKGIGEIGIVGMNAAIANAVFHATGKRIRDMPIRIEKLV